MNGLAGVGLKQAVGAEKSSGGAWDVIGWDFQGAQHAAVVHKRPGNVSDALNCQALGDSLEFYADGRDFQWSHKIRTVWGD